MPRYKDPYDTRNKYHKYRGVRDLKSFSKMSPKHRQLMRRIKWTLSGEKAFTSGMDELHRRRFAEISSVLAQMSEGEREKFIQENWIAFEPIFENSEKLRSDAHFRFEEDTANSLVDWMYNQIVEPLPDYEPSKFINLETRRWKL